MKVVLDTNVYCLCDTGHEGALRFLEEAEGLFLPVIAYGELYYGFRYGTRFEENLRRLERFLGEFEVGIITVDKDVARRFGDIYASLKDKGKPIPTNDIWISACCMKVSGTLFTTDRHFAYVDQIQSEVLSLGPP